ncbi:hypothetical protein AGOR_G00116120 [Albula goreensis]|uniref:G-protein coupled receptors family 1 profile domain-containing protein n=1 Tax=Albula goreensis TaxID=1534307 RepID=A0A8T3DHM7_9TELE|nr:hypothetical protein AGOR_G00116120 [Albula goreensis]
MVQEAPHPFPTVDVPDHAHYTIGAVILIIGITGMVGNFLVIYAFSRSRSLRTPANMFIINLAITDFLMCATQAPIFFTTSMHKRWIFGEKGCELYAFCGALFGICSMITLMVIAVDRYFVITRPLASIGVLSRKRALVILLAAWVYSLGWSLPPFFGWSAYVPEGLLTSCTWDYVTFTPSVRAYTMLLFTFVFFIPLIVIMFCYFFIFRAIRDTNKAVNKISGNNTRDSLKRFHRLKNEWKMAKIALIVILLYVISWSPYSSVALTAFAGYADILTPYMNSVPAVIAKASAIHNPIIYAITHPKYRLAIAKYIPCLGVLLCVQPKDLQSTSSFMSTRRSTVTSQTSDISNHFHRGGKSRLSSASDSESVRAHHCCPSRRRPSRRRCPSPRLSLSLSRVSSTSESESGWTDTEADLSSLGSRPASRQVSCEISRDTAEVPDLKPSSSLKSKLKSHDSGIFEKTSVDADDISMADASQLDRSSPPVASDVMEGVGLRAVAGRIPSIVITSESSPAYLPFLRSSSRGSRARTANGSLGVGSVTIESQGHAQLGSVLPSTAPSTSAPPNNI